MYFFSFFLPLFFFFLIIFAAAEDFNFYTRFIGGLLGGEGGEFSCGRPSITGSAEFPRIWARSGRVPSLRGSCSLQLCPGLARSFAQRTGCTGLRQCERLIAAFEAHWGIKAGRTFAR